MKQRLVSGAAVLAVGMLAAAPAVTQVRTVDPSSSQVQANRANGDTADRDPPEPVPVDEGNGAPPPASDAHARDVPRAQASGDTVPASATYQEQEVFGAAEEVFGKGAKGLAEMLQKLLKDQGLPNAYIAGREGGGAFAVGLRYGQGTMYHKVEGQKDVFWSGPSIGFDVGGNGAKTFVLVYNLYDGADLFRRYPMVEGNLYAIGGFTASYLRRGSVVLIPVRLGVGWRFGAAAGYMKFTKKGTIIPF